jgi:hypothetical protein
MIPKKSANSPNPKDYRPISLTSCLGKLCERMILDKLTDFLDANKLIVKQQSGFRKHRQTKDNIFYLIQKISESFNRKKRVCGIFFDIASAFDKVWHKGVIYKMVLMKIPFYIIDWINSFLENRTFKIKVESFISIEHRITAGVPQGAVLSPTLFSIFINDIPKPDAKNKAGSLLFADDLAVTFIFRNAKEVSNRIKKYLTNLEAWLGKWRLLMAPTKCNLVNFGKQTATTKVDANLFGVPIPESNSALFLGIRFDSKLNFEDQISYIEETSSKRLNILKILANKKWKIKKSLLSKIYIMIIRSVIDYSSVILSSLSETRLLRLQRIQNSAIRTIYGLPKYTRISELHELAKIELIKDRLNKLNEKYIRSNLLNKNPLIQELCIEHLNFTGARILSTATPLCVINKEELRALLNALNPP